MNCQQWKLLVIKKYQNQSKTIQLDNNLQMRPSKYKKGKKAAAFISNLYKILQDPPNHLYIKWRQDEESFIILNISKFTQTVLPQYYKHKNYSSFVRQLNMYNFNKMRSQLEGEHIYRNQLFLKNSQENIKNIKRREVVTNKNNPITTLAHALNNQIRSQDSQQDFKNKISQNCGQNQIVQVAAPSAQFSYFVDFPCLQSLRLTHSISDYLVESDDYLFETDKINNSIPSVIPLGCQKTSFQFKSMIDQMEVSQNQLQQVCIGLYKQNKFLTVQNKRIQEKLRAQSKNKQQIVSQIIKYVIKFLSQWSANYNEVDQQNQGNPQAVISEEESSSDIVLQSYETLNQRQLYKKNSTQKKHKNPNKNSRFSKYPQNQNKILLTLLKQIEKSYNQKLFFTGVNQGSNYKHEQDASDYNHNYSSSSANSFLMSMLLKFIQSNNLTQVVKRFSFLLNLEGNKKSKNFTFSNYMKDLTEHFKIRQFQKSSQFQDDLIKIKQEKGHKMSGLQYIADKQGHLYNQKETINQMEKQLALITNQNNIQKEFEFILNENSNFKQKKQQPLRLKPENFKILTKPFKISLHKNSQK